LQLDQLACLLVCIFHICFQLSDTIDAVQCNAPCPASRLFPLFPLRWTAGLGELARRYETPILQVLYPYGVWRYCSVHCTSTRRSRYKYNPKRESNASCRVSIIFGSAIYIRDSQRYCSMKDIFAGASSEVSHPFLQASTSRPRYGYSYGVLVSFVCCSRSTPKVCGPRARQ
jgi:hypothetical protein